jgi:cell wall-associated NlpC family hydrolase
MKWIIGIVVLIFAGWMATVFLVNKIGGTASLVVRDSLQVIQPLTVSVREDSMKAASLINLDTPRKNKLSLFKGSIDTRNVQPQQIVEFAKTLVGVPYLYGSTDPARGFDCSGFITYVFNHFDIVVPRSSIDFTAVGKEVSIADAKPGDLILFTGTDSTERSVGHMGIVTDNASELNFIHATSGKQYAVTVTPLSDYYKGRYVKTVRVFP